jgi:hypothetical protein
MAIATKNLKVTYYSTQQNYAESGKEQTLYYFAKEVKAGARCCQQDTQFPESKNGLF